MCAAGARRWCRHRLRDLCRAAGGPLGVRAGRRCTPNGPELVQAGRSANSHHGTPVIDADTSNPKPTRCPLGLRHSRFRLGRPGCSARARLRRVPRQSCLRPISVEYLRRSGSYPSGQTTSPASHPLPISGSALRLVMATRRSGRISRQRYSVDASTEGDRATAADPAGERAVGGPGLHQS